MKIATRAQIDPFLVMEAFREAEQMSARGESVLHLSVGQPSALAPPEVLQFAAEQIARHPLGYTDASGIAPLRERIALHYAQQYGLTIDPARIFVTVGSSAAYMMALMAAFDVGDRMALVAPHYAATPNMMQALGIEPVVMPSTGADHYQPSCAMLQSLPKPPDGLVIASPSNPTGTVIAPEEMQRLAQYCEAQGIRILSDEIYHGVTYGDRRAASILEFSDQMIVTNSFSKYYLLPGWRLGWMVVPQAMCRTVESLLQNFFISAPAIGQYAALKAMDCRAQLDAVVAGYRTNRDVLLAALQEMGITQVAPAEGAFYLYADISHLSNDSLAFSQKLLAQTGVCTVSGRDFDKSDGARFLRLSYCGSESTIREAAARMKAWLKA